MTDIIDPERPDVVVLSGGQALHNVHPAALCQPPCTIHSPSDHHMRDWTLIWRDDRRIFEWVCPHGVGHPDPDQMSFLARHGQAWQAVHGCDGCCMEVGP